MKPIKKLTGALLALVMILTLLPVDARAADLPAATVKTAPTAKNWTYDTKKHYLITTGEAENGEMYYRLGSSGDFSKGEIPMATDAGTYAVYYKAVGAGGSSDARCIKVTVDKATYNGQSKFDVVVSRNASKEAILTLGLPEKLNCGVISRNDPYQLIWDTKIINVSTLQYSTYKINADAEATITIPVSGTNYRNFTVTVTVTAKDLKDISRAVSIASANGSDYEVKVRYGDKTTQFSKTVPTDMAGTNGYWTWNSSDPAVATVDKNGKVTFHKIGDTKIEAAYVSDSTFGIATQIGLSVTVDVTVKPGSNMKKTRGSETQKNISGGAIDEVIYEANDGYYFPQNYIASVDNNSTNIKNGITGGGVNGITVTRIDYGKIKVGGEPTKDVTITLPAATKKEAEATPTANFYALDADSGELKGVASGMKYQIVKGNTSRTYDITSDTVTVYGLSKDCTINVYMPATYPEYMADSEMRPITITQAAKPSLSHKDCSVYGVSDGSITGLSAGVYYQYKLGADAEYISVPVGTTEIKNLAAGTYYVRVHASRAQLASPDQELKIIAPDPTYSVEVIAPTFEAVTEGYNTPPEAKPITIYGRGNSDTTIKSVAVSGAYFILNDAEASATVPYGGKNETYTIRPDTGAPVGTHKATISVTYYTSEDHTDVYTYTTTADVSFTVLERTYKVSVEENIPNGTVSVSSVYTYMHAKDTVPVTVTPNAGYRAKEVYYVKGDTDPYLYTITADAQGKYEFTMPAQPVTVSATFEEIPTHKVTIKEDITNGAVYINSGDVYNVYAYVLEGDTVTLKVTPEDGYAITEVYYYCIGEDAVPCKITADEDGKYAFKVPAIGGDSTITIDAAFELIPTYKVSVASGIKHGTVSLGVSSVYPYASEGDTSPTSVYSLYAKAGDTIPVSVTADKGYKIYSVSSDVYPYVLTADAQGKYEFKMPTQPVTVSAVFEPLELTGKVTVSGKAKVGETLSATVSETNNTGTLYYQWMAGDKAISEPTTSIYYTLTADTQGKKISCVVTSSEQTGSIQSAPTGSVSAADVKKYKVTVAEGIEHGTASVSSTYLPAGDTVTVSVTPENGYALDEITTEPSQTVKDGKFTMPASDVVVNVTFKLIPVKLTGKVTITGVTRVGETLSATVSGSNYTGTLFYQWMADGEAISGATQSTYTLTEEMLGKKITCVVTSSDQEGSIEGKADDSIAPAPEIGISLNRTQMNLFVGDYGYLVATASPAGADVTWSTSNSRVVSVDASGNYSAVGIGSATITATVAGKKSAVCSVVVNGQNAISSAYYPTEQPTDNQTNNQSANNQEFIASLNQPTTQTVDNKDGTKQVVNTATDGTASIIKTDENGYLVSAAMSYSGSTVQAAARWGSTLVFPVEVRAAGSASNAPELHITVPQASPSIKVKIPVANMTAGTVVMAENMFGQDMVVKNETVSRDGLTFPLSGSTVVRIVDNTKQFYDVTGSEWFAGAVLWASSHEVMNGVEDHIFNPRGKMTRAMMAQLLYNFADADSSHVTTAFTDVSTRNWYGASVTWAAERGIAYVSGDRFGATDDLTREDMVSMLFNYAAQAGYNTQTRANITGFADYGEISDWARPAMAWAVGTGLINGMGDNRLSPQDVANRAQLAAIMQRFCQTIAR